MIVIPPLYRCKSYKYIYNNSHKLILVKNIIMLDNKVMDVGPGEGLSPWSDDDEYERLF